MIAPPALPPATEAVTLWLLLRSFASGCTAMTGVEAVSNGVSAFKEPTVKNAHRTLTVIVAVLAVLLGGVAYLSHAIRSARWTRTSRGARASSRSLPGRSWGGDGFIM